MQADQGIFATTMNAELQTANGRMMAMESTIRDREEAIRRAFDSTTALRAAELAKVVADAKSEFDTQRTTQRDSLNGIATAVQAELHSLQQRVEQVEQGAPRAEGGKGGGKRFLPIKELKPPKLSKEDQWRDWS